MSLPSASPTASPSLSPSISPTFSPTDTSSSASPSLGIGLIPYLLICTIFLLFLTTFLLKSYAHYSVPKHALFITWLSWTLCFSVVYILPLDFQPNLSDNNAMYPFYVALYWFCFFLTWILTPFQSAYIKSGGFTAKFKLFDAVKFNLIFFTVIGIVAVIGYIYLLVATGFSASKLGAVLQAFGNLWGLSFAIMTMGYGLVEIPRYFYYKSDYNKQLIYLYFKITQLQENKENARDRVDELLYIYNKSFNKYKSEFVYEYARMEKEIIPNYELERSKKIKMNQIDLTFNDLNDHIDNETFKSKHLRKISMLFKIWLFQLERTNSMYKKTMSDVFYFEGMISTQIEFKSISNSNTGTKSPSINDDLSNIQHIRKDEHDINNLPFYSAYYYKFRIYGMPIIQKIFAVLCMMMSLIIIWSEFMLIIDYMFSGLSLSIFALIQESTSGGNISILFGVAGFGYLSSCSLFALWRIHINKDYHMHPYQLTDSGSILTNCAFSMRFMFPLGYNFLLLTIPYDKRSPDKYPFLKLFHDMSVLPIIGDPVNIFLPLLVILFCLATWFNVYGKLMKKLRISRFEFGDPDKKYNDDINDNINEGKMLVKKYKNQLKNDVVKLNEFKSYINNRFANKSLFATINESTNSNQFKSQNNKLLFSNDSISLITEQTQKKY